MQPINLRSLAARLTSSEPTMLGGAAIFVGLASGAGVWLFKWLIGQVHNLAFGRMGAALAGLGTWGVILVPVTGGLVVGLILHFWIGHERHHGVPGVMEAAALEGGRLEYRRMPAKALAAALSIGFGASVGPEDPSVQIGANFGSLMGQVLHLSDERVRALVAAGAASGIAAAFNAPIAGVFFALEVVLSEIGGQAFWVVVLAAVTSAVFTQAVSGAQPAFHVPSYAINTARVLPFYLGLGLLAGPVSVLYIRLLYWIQDLFQKIGMVPGWVKAALAGLLVGMAGIFLPQLFGIGYDTIEHILGGVSIPILLLIGIMIGKLVLTPVSLGGGFQGGVFAPALFIGAALGAAYGGLIDHILPGLALDPPAFAMVGMAAVLAGTVHAPLTAILLLFEMTNEYRIILPLMFAVLVSLLVSQRLQPDSVYTTALARKGIRLIWGRDLDVMESVRVEEVMVRQPATVRVDLPIEQLREEFIRTGRHGFPVLNPDGTLFGAVSLEDYRRVLQKTPQQVTSLTAGDIATCQLVTIHPDETVGAALRKMAPGDLSRLPVVPRSDEKILLGVVRRGDIVRAYELGRLRREETRRRAFLAQSVLSVDAEFVDVPVLPESAVAGKTIAELELPKETVLVSVRRGGQLLIPHGDTRLRAGDVITALCERGSVEQFRYALRAEQAGEPIHNE